MKSFCLFTLILMVSIVGCDRSGRSIVLSIPDGFNGLFLVSEDTKNGLEPQMVDGNYVLVIPQNGRLVIKDLDIFSRWHKEVGRYRNGTYIPYETPTNDTETAVFGLPYVPGKGHYFFVGSRKDFDPISKKYDYDKLPLATKMDASMLEKH